MIIVATLPGDLTAVVTDGDWVIRDADGNRHPEDEVSADTLMATWTPDDDELYTDYPEWYAAQDTVQLLGGEIVSGGPLPNPDADEEGFKE